MGEGTPLEELDHILQSVRYTPAEGYGQPVQAESFKSAATSPLYC